MKEILPLQKGVIYGPIESRRLGRSMGINLMPTKYKLCSFNCVYCHYGLTDKLSLEMDPFLADLPDFDCVIKEVDDILQSKEEFDYLTFSGNGEPTLHPAFKQLAAEIARLRDHYRPSVKIALLSNSTGLIHDRVHQAVEYIDMPVFKLDAGCEEKFKDINRPAKGIGFEKIIDQLAVLGDIVLQSVFLDGTPENIGENDIRTYFEKVKHIKPRAVHIYSIDRPVPNTAIKRVQPEKLNQIAQYGQERTGIRVTAFYLE